MTPNLELKLALSGNGVFSLGCAIPMILAEQSLGIHLGISPWWIFAVGLVVGLNGLLLLGYALSSWVPRTLITGAVLGDAAWVVGSIVLLLANPGLTSKGVIAVAAVALVVGLFGWFQNAGLRAA